MKKGMIAGLTLMAVLAGTGLAAKPERPMGHEQIPGGATNTFQSLEFGVLLKVRDSPRKWAAEYLHAKKLDNNARRDLLTVQLGLEF